MDEKNMIPDYDDEYWDEIPGESECEDGDEDAYWRGQADYEAERLYCE